MLNAHLSTLYVADLLGTYAGAAGRDGPVRAHCPGACVDRALWSVQRRHIHRIFFLFLLRRKKDGEYIIFGLSLLYPVSWRSRDLLSVGVTCLSNLPLGSKNPLRDQLLG